MTGTWSRRPLALVVVLLASWLSTNCSPSNSGQRESGGVGSSGASESAIAIEKTSSYLTIENRAGLPLVDIRIVVKVANGLAFSALVPRLETAAKRDVSFGNLRSNDGTSFSPQWQRPREIVVTATDLVAKKHELTVPWR